MPDIELENRVLEYIASHQGRLFETLQRLIQFPSVNHLEYGEEYDCQLFVKEMYKQLGLHAELYYPDVVPGVTAHAAYLPGRGTDKRPNVSAEWCGLAPERRVMLAAHADVIDPGAAEEWSVPPFAGAMQDGRIIGRGAADDKCGIAAAWFAIKALMDCKIRLRDSVVLTSYCDEEYGGGNGALAAALRFPCDTYVNLDGGGYEIWDAALGGGGYRLILRRENMTDTAEPVVHAMYKALCLISEYFAVCRDSLDRNPRYHGTSLARSAGRLLDFNCGNFASDLHFGSLSILIYTDKPKAVLQAELEELHTNICVALRDVDITIEPFRPVTRFFTYDETRKESAALMALKAAAEQTGQCCVPQRGACMSDLSVFLSAGSTDSFNFGLFRDFSEPGGAHQPDEYVNCGQFLAFTQALALFLLRHCGGREA